MHVYKIRLLPVGWIWLNWLVDWIQPNALKMKFVLFYPQKNKNIGNENIQHKVNKVYIT